MVTLDQGYLQGENDYINSVVAKHMTPAEDPELRMWLAVVQMSRSLASQRLISWEELVNPIWTFMLLLKDELAFDIRGISTLAGVTKETTTKPSSRILLS